MSDDLCLLPDILCDACKNESQVSWSSVNKIAKEILTTFLIDSLTKMGFTCTGKSSARVNSYRTGIGNGSIQIIISLAIPVQTSNSRSTSIHISICIKKDKDGKFNIERGYRDLCYVYPRNESTRQLKMAGKEVGYDILRAFGIYNFDGLYKAPEF